MDNATMSLNSDTGHIVPPWWCLYHFSPIELEIFFQIALHGRHLYRSISHLTALKPASRLSISYIPLAVHLLISLAEIIRFYTLLFVSDRSPLPTVGLDLVLCVINTATALGLARITPRGAKSKVLRVHYQVVALMRLTATGAAVWFALRGQHVAGGGDGGSDNASAETARWLHRASIKLLNSFAYDRWLMEVLPRMRLYDFWTSFGLAAFIGGSLAVWEGDYPGGMPGYCAWMGGLIVFEDWVGKVARTR
jgi:hypothetical protein